MTVGLVNPADPPERQIEKLLTIASVLMRRVEQITDDSGAAYAQFQRAAMLEDQVRERTRELERALDLLNASNAALAAANPAASSGRRNSFRPRSRRWSNAGRILRLCNGSGARRSGKEP